MRQHLLFGKQLSLFILLCMLLSWQQPAFAKKKKKDKSTSEAGKKNDYALQSLFIDGTKAYLLGNNEEAVAKFNEVLKKDKNNAAAYYQLSRIAFENGNAAKALSFINSAINIDPKNEYYFMYQAEEKASLGDYEGAAKAYETLTKLYPRDYDNYFSLGYMLTKANKYREAIDAYNLLEQKTGVSEELTFQKQPLFIKLGKIDEGAKDIEKLVKAYPDEPRYIGLIGELYEANKQYDKAIEAYNRVFAVEPDNAEAMLALSEVYRKKGDEAKRLEYINKVFGNKNIDIDTKIYSFIPFVERLQKDSSTESRDAVMKMADMIVAAHPDNIKAVTVRADALLNSNKKSEALAEYLKAISMDEAPGTVWVQIYLLDAEMEQYDSLIAHTKLGISKNPKDVLGYFYNALGYQNKKEYSPAFNTLQKGFDVMKSNKPDAFTYTPQLKLQMLISLGDVAFELKKYETSDSAYDAALEIDPNNATVLNNYAYYLSERNIKLEKAERMSKKSNLLVDNNSAFIDTYAWIMYKMKNYKEALEWMEQAMQIPDSKERAELLTHYGDILYKVGRVDDAMQQWQKAIDKGGDKTLLQDKIKNKKAD